MGSYAGWPNHPAYIEHGYGYNMMISRLWDQDYLGNQHLRVKDVFWKHPARTGIMAEMACFYWHNDLGSDGSVAYMYADRHKTGKAYVLFMDFHVSFETTPFPNSGPDNIRDPS